MWLAHHITSSLISIGPAQSCTVTVKGVLVELEGGTPQIKRAQQAGAQRTDYYFCTTPCRVSSAPGLADRLLQFHAPEPCRDLCRARSLRSVIPETRICQRFDIHSDFCPGMHGARDYPGLRARNSYEPSFSR